MSVASRVICTSCPFRGAYCARCIVAQHPARLYLYVAAAMLGVLTATLVACALDAVTCCATGAAS